MKKLIMIAAIVGVALAGCSEKETELPKTIKSVAAQSGTITSGTAGTATFVLTTANIANGRTGSVAWFSNADGTTSASAPAGISASVSAVANNAATVTITATTAAAAGTYYFKVTIDGISSAVATLNITAAPLTYAISASPDNPSFGSLVEGYTQPAAQTVTITNTGSGTITLNALPTVSNYMLTALSTTSLAAGATATFTIRPEAGLTEGSYNPTFDVTGSNSVSVTISPTFEVTAVPLTYGISASPDNPSFGSLGAGYTQPAAQTVTITNTGTGAVTLNALPAVSNYTLSALSTTSLAAGATAIFTIRPNAGLTEGTYSPTFDVTGSNSVSVTISPTFTVANVPVTGITLSPNPLTVMQGGTNKFTVTITPSDATDKSVTWETASTNITIAPDGTITGVTAITGIIVTARSVSNPTVTGSAYVNVVSYTDRFEKDGIYYSLISGSNVRVTNQQYTESLVDGMENSYSGAVVVPATVEYGGITYNVTQVGNRAFMEFESGTPLTSVTLPNSITQIGISAFSNCVALTALNLPEGLLSIGANAFSGCTNLATLHLPASLNSIDAANSIFGGCENLSITVASGNTIFSVDASGVLYQAQSGNPQYNLRWIPLKLTGAYTIPDGVVLIATNATAYGKLTEIRIPASVTAIDINNFQVCANLTDIWLNWAVPPTGITPSFSGTNISAITLYVPAGTLLNYEAHPLWQTFGNIVEQP
ncbi:MAG: leucine-rich repeat protein [Bacteroidales bacterium]|nr:leucine-rich repeat protein [Bacteroidales bacterium]